MFTFSRLCLICMFTYITTKLINQFVSISYTSSESGELQSTNKQCLFARRHPGACRSSPWLQEGMHWLTTPGNTLMPALPIAETRTEGFRPHCRYCLCAWVKLGTPIARRSQRALECRVSFWFECHRVKGWKNPKIPACCKTLQLKASLKFHAYNNKKRCKQRMYGCEYLQSELQTLNFKRAIDSRSFDALLCARTS